MVSWMTLAVCIPVTRITSDSTYLVSLPNDSDYQWIDIADITISSVHKNHGSEFNTAVVLNSRLIISKTFTQTWHFYTLKPLVSQVLRFSLSSQFTWDHNWVLTVYKAMRIVLLHCFSVWKFVRHPINMRPHDVKGINEEHFLKFSTVYFKKTRARKELLLYRVEGILLLPTHQSYIEHFEDLLRYTGPPCCFGFLFCLFPNTFYL